MTELQEKAFKAPWIDDSQRLNPPIERLTGGLTVGLSLNL